MLSLLSLFVDLMTSSDAAQKTEKIVTITISPSHPAAERSPAEHISFCALSDASSLQIRQRIENNNSLERPHHQHQENPSKSAKSTQTT
jgi:hypothetical protein